MPKLAPVVVDGDLLSRLGEIVVKWSGLEQWLSHLLATMVDADPGGMTVITNTAGAATQIQWLLTIISVFEHKQPDLQEVVDLVNRADDMRTDRNALSHGLWDQTGCESGTCFVETYNWRHTEITKKWLITKQDLDDMIASIDEWIDDYQELGLRFNFPRRRGETKSIFAD